VALREPRVARALCRARCGTRVHAEKSWSSRGTR